MVFTQKQLALVVNIDHVVIRGVVEELGQLGCEVLVTDQAYRVDDEIYSFGGLVAFLCAHAQDADGNVLNSPASVGLGITRYQQIVGVKPVAEGLRENLCQAKDVDHAAAWAGARRIASWSLAGAGPLDAGVRELRITEAAHVILRWVENVKCRILGLPLDGQQIILDFFGESGAFKTISMKHLLSPLGDLVLKTPQLEAVLAGYAGVKAAMNVAIWLDDSVILSRSVLPILKDFVHSDNWRANSKGKDEVTVPMLASLACTHNPWPEQQYPDPALSRRLGIVHYPGALGRKQGREYVDREILSMDMVAFWKVVDPVKRQSDDDIIEASQRRFAIKDPISWFMEDCTARKSGTDTYLSDFYAAFRVRAQTGGWQVGHWTDRSLAAWLRSQSFVLVRGAQGMKIRGLKLLQPGLLADEEVEAAGEAE